MNIKILSTIEKLLKHSESAAKIGSQKEAEAFAVQARQLMVQHKIELSELDLQDECPEEEVTKEFVSPNAWGDEQQKRKTPWKVAMAYVLAPSYFCSVLGMKGSNGMVVIGTNSDREAFICAIQGLFVAAEALCDSAYASHIRAGGRKDNTWRRSYLFGFANGMRDRIEIEKVREKEENSTSDLMVINNQVQRVNNVLSQTKTVKTSNSTGRNANARDKGYQAGRANHTKAIS